MIFPSRLCFSDCPLQLPEQQHYNIKLFLYSVFHRLEKYMVIGDENLDAQANDSLHILPLAILPLETPALRRARLVKNTRLEGVIELFSDRDTGAGQIRPEALESVVQVDTGGQEDIRTVSSLSLLGSYDVYSLRIEFRRLGIKVDFDRHLRLSPETQRSLSTHMSGFTRPLATYVFGDEDVDGADFQSIMMRFADPDVAEARAKLKSLCQRLEISTEALPLFLHDYGDVYLSLAFYQSKLDENLPLLAEFNRAITALEESQDVGRSPRMANLCSGVRQKIGQLVQDVRKVLEVFKARTRDIWQNPSASQFREIEDMIRSVQRAIGTALCAVTVKLNAWHDKVISSPRARTEDQIGFLMSEMVPGLESVKRISFTGA